MADHIDDTEERTGIMIVSTNSGSEQTAGVGAYMTWKQGSWPARQGGTRKKDFLEGYGEALRGASSVLGAEVASQIEAAIREGRL